MKNAIVYDHTAQGGAPYTCQFPSGPSSYAPVNNRVQASDISRGGSLYVYDRGVKYVTHKLTYKQIDDDCLNVLEVIMDLSAGETYTVADWHDHTGAVHRIRFKGPLSHIETAPGKYQVTFTLEEYL